MQCLVEVSQDGSIRFKVISDLVTTQESTADYSIKFSITPNSVAQNELQTTSLSETILTHLLSTL